jgi:hypothetical protein
VAHAGIRSARKQDRQAQAGRDFRSLLEKDFLGAAVAQSQETADTERKEQLEEYNG